MKKNFNIILFFIAIQFSAQAQIESFFADEFPDSSKTRIGLMADYDLNSNALTSQFINKFYKGKYLDTDLKNSVLDRVKNNNQVGANINYSVYGVFKTDSLFHKKNISIFFSIKDREHFDARFSKDLFKVGFYGNADYAGKIADFNGFDLNLLRYQQFQIGILLSKSDTSSRFGIGLSFLKGEQYKSIHAKKAELFTSEDGQTIDFNTSFQVAQSDTATNGLGAFNGYGASADIYFEAPYKTRIGKSKLRVSVADIGLIRFNKQSLYLNQDSLFHYTGFTVNSIYQLQDSTFAKTSKDSIMNAIAPLKKQSVSVSLPAILNLSFETQLNKHVQLTEGIQYVFNANYNLLFYVKGNFILTNNIAISATVGYGGYGNFNYGIGAFANFGNGFLIYVGSHNMEGYLAPKKTCGQSAYISLVKNFK